MEKITTAGAQFDVASTDIDAVRTRSAIAKDELRTLADYELFLVGGGDDGPGWTPPK